MFQGLGTSRIPSKGSGGRGHLVLRSRNIAICLCPILLLAMTVPRVATGDTTVALRSASADKDSQSSSSNLPIAREASGVVSRGRARLRWAPTSGPAGDTIRLRGSRLPPKRRVRIRFGGVALKGGRIGREGRYRKRITIPPIPLGLHLVRLRAGSIALTFRFTVTARRAGGVAPPALPGPIAIFGPPGPVALAAPPPAPQLPSASFIASPDPAPINQAVRFDATPSSTPNGQITHYQWDLDGNGTFETDSGSSPVAFHTYTTPGTVTVGLRVIDTAGATANAANELIVTRSPPPPDTTPPMVSLTSPSPGATVSGTAALAANASDETGVAGVQFRLDGANLGSEDTTSPYSVAWDTTQTNDGSHLLTAVARDLAGNTTTSASITVTVANAPPPPPPATAPPYRFIYNSGSAPATAASYGWNLIDVGDKAAADALPEGTKGLVWVGDYDNTSCSWEVSDDSLTSEVTSMIADPKVAGYLFSDEPDPFACPNAPAEHKARSNLIHSLDPAALTVFVIDSNSGQASLSQIPLWVGVADAAGLDPYPCTQGLPCDFAWIDQIIQAANQAGLTYWGVAQAFNDGPWRWPTPDEEKHMLSQWAASRETGYMTFAWTWAGSSLSSRPGLLDVLKSFNSTGGPLPPPSRGGPVITAAGDICSTPTDCAPTASLVEQINPTRALTLGDNAYPDGSPSDYSSYYEPNWGRFKAKTSPTPGNHEYHLPGAQGYFDYFGPRAPAPYYSYDLGAWHLISLNSEIDHSDGSAQETWLKNDLAVHPAACTLAYWHRPRFSSGAEHGSDPSLDPFWQDLYAAGADIVLSGHDHVYERFAPQNPSGGADESRGIREWVVGTGGAPLYSFTAPITNSEARDNTSFGVLKLTLHTSSYDWKFVPVAGSSFTDSGSGTCH